MPAPQAVQLKGAALLPSPDSVLTGAPGSLVWTLKMMLELGNRIPRMTWARFPAGGNTGAALPPTAGLTVAALAPVSTIDLSPASSAVNSVFPAGNLPACKMYATNSAASEAFSFPGSSAGIVFRILLASSDRGCAPHTVKNALPANGGAAFPSSASP